MKFKLVFLIFYLLGNLYCVAQEKFDYQWMVGYPPDGGLTQPLYGAYLMDFNDDSLKFIKVPEASLVTIQTSASICDKSGKLRLYSNGCQIHNGDFQQIEGCEKVNPGLTWDEYCSDPAFAYYPTLQSELILPFPEKEDQYFYLSQRKEFSTKYNYEQYHYNTEFYYCNVIDMSLSNGKGKSVDNFNIEYPDEVKAFNLAACKHSNGKDWWILNFSFNSKKIYRTLLTKDGISGPWAQDAGPPREAEDDVGQSVFSPDGKKFAFVYSVDGKAYVYDFDRKTGLVSNEKIIQYEIKQDWPYRGIAFSPNSKLLYVSACYYMYQFNLEATDLQQSKILLGENDGYGLPDWPYYIPFGFMQLGPDGKIYVGQLAGAVRQWSIINKPNMVGLASDFRQHSLTFPGYSCPAAPIQPNFRLGADTISSISQIPSYKIEMKSWFNTSSKMIKCWLQHLPKENNEYTLVVSDVTGRKHISQNISVLQYQEDISIDGSSLLSGVYFVSLLDKGRLISSDKVIVY